MALTTIRGKQVLDGTIQRHDLDVSTVGQAVVAKLFQGTNVTLSSTGGDAGTGDVTINAPNAVTAHTTTTASMTVPNHGSTTTVTVVDASWVAVGEMLYIAGAAGSGQAGILQVTAIASNTLTLLNP
jgi:ABC-type uncharacterized transport system ATPase subunit